MMVENVRSKRPDGLYPTLKAIRLFGSTRLRRAGHLARTVDNRNIYGGLGEDR